MHEGHRQELMERYIKEGLDHFEDHQVIELLLFYAIPRRDTSEIAHRLLLSFGSISNIFEADIKDLMNVENIGKNTAVFLKLIYEISKRYRLDSKKERLQINTAKEAGNYAIELFYGEAVEKVYLICMDMRSKVIHSACLFEGTIHEAPLYPRKVVAEALKNNAAKVILAHNHPGGNAKPSAKDLETTAILMDVLKYVDVDLIDHIIVGKDDYISLAAMNLLGQNTKDRKDYTGKYEK